MKFTAIPLVLRRAAAFGLLLGAASCGDMSREGTSPAYLVVTQITAASGAEPGNLVGNLLSDVLTLVKKDDVYVATIFNDVARVDFQLALKDAGTAAAITKPTPNNYITVDRYHVDYVRSDGRNTPGVDVPYGFDGAATVTVADTASVAFELVRHSAKQEAPLAALAANRTIITTIAQVTFYGRDQTGRSVSTTAKILVDFGNFADPD